VIAESVEEREVELVFRFEVVEDEAAEVGEEDVAGRVVSTAAVVEVADVGEGLALGGFEGMAGGLVFDENLTGPEEIDEAGGAGEAADGLFEGSDGATGDAEDIEEVVPEGLLVGLLAGGVLPLAREEQGAVADLVPGDVGHEVSVPA